MLHYNKQEYMWRETAVDVGEGGGEGGGWQKRQGGINIDSQQIYYYYDGVAIFRISFDLYMIHREFCRIWNHDIFLITRVSLSVWKWPLKRC